VAQKFGKRNSDVLRDIRNLSCSDNFHQRNFALMVDMKPLPQGGATKIEYYIMTKDGFSFLVMGYTGKEAGKFKEDFIDAFNKMDAIIKSGGYQIPGSFKEALLLAAKQQEQIEAQQQQLEAQQPAVVFTQSVTNSDTNITVRELAKLLCQNGCEIGEHRLYSWLVENKYLIRHTRYSQSKQRYETDYYEPYQCWVEKGLFFTSETVIGTGDSSFIKRTVYVTGKGQCYFIRKFLYEKERNNPNESI
jgi:anti-repressor protein